MGLSIRVACVHPAWFTALWLLWLVGGGAVPAEIALAIPPLLSLAPFSWMFGLYRATGRAVLGGSSGHQWIFWITGAALLATAVILALEGDSILATMRFPPILVALVPVWVIGALAAGGLTARALSVFDQERPRTTGEIGLLLLLWPIGAWVLRPTVLRLRQVLGHEAAAVQG